MSSSLLSTTLGLIIHSLADGMSLGASEALPAEKNPDAWSLDLIVLYVKVLLILRSMIVDSLEFCSVAIMMHKAPAAFGLTSVLLGEGASKGAVRRSLLLFSISAPVGALVTYGALSLMSTRDQDLQWWTAIALLFSGGTMLFVASHLMQDVGDVEHDDSSSSSTEHVGKATKVTTLVFGMMTPMFLQSLLAHHHPQ
jgi:zinc transporter 9